MDLDYREIGRNIRYYRLKKGMNQRELAERVHVARVDDVADVALTDGIENFLAAVADLLFHPRADAVGL